MPREAPRLPTIGPRWWIAFAQWLQDKRWAANMIRARRERRRLKTFSQKEVFDDVLRPRCSQDLWIKGFYPYPDALYEITARDVGRAMVAARCFEKHFSPRVAAENFIQERDL